MPSCNQCKRLYYVSSGRSERRLPRPSPGPLPLCCLRHRMKVAQCCLAQIWPTSAVLVRRWWWRRTCSETAGGYTARHTLFYPDTTHLSSVSSNQCTHIFIVKRFFKYIFLYRWWKVSAFSTDVINPIEVEFLVPLIANQPSLPLSPLSSQSTLQ